MTGALVLLIAWIAAALTYARADRTAAASILMWLQRHNVFWAVIFAIGTAVLVSRRRALNQIAASRSWTAALPVERSTMIGQALAVETSPAVVLACALAAAFGSLIAMALLDTGMPMPISTWAATTAGVVLGAALSYLLPAPKPREMYEGSRYVPHRRRAQTPIPTGSLSPLGSWPVHQMFASARPKTVARVMVPALLAVPLGSTAADAMVAIGLLTAIGALVLLIAAAISVSGRASQWLKPLPLSPGLLARRALIPALALMSCASAIESWLLSLLGSPITRCITVGLLTLIAGVIFAVAGSLFSVYSGNKRTDDRL